MASHYLGRSENVSAAGLRLAPGGPALQQHRPRPRPEQRLPRRGHHPPDRPVAVQHHVHRRILACSSCTIAAPPFPVFAEASGAVRPRTTEMPPSAPRVACAPRRPPRNPLRRALCQRAVRPGTPHAPEPVNDRELIGRVLAGDPRAERELYDAHVDRVFRLVYRMAGDPHRAQDYTQETFIRAFERLADFRGESALSTWLCAIAISVTLNGLPVSCGGHGTGRSDWTKRPAHRHPAVEADPDLKVRLRPGDRRAAGGIPHGVRDARRRGVHARGDRHARWACSRAPRRRSCSGPAPSCATRWPISRGDHGTMDDEPLDDRLRGRGQRATTRRRSRRARRCGAPSRRSGAPRAPPGRRRAAGYPGPRPPRRCWRWASASAGSRSRPRAGVAPVAWPPGRGAAGERRPPTASPRSSTSASPRRSSRCSAPRCADRRAGAARLRRPPGSCWPRTGCCSTRPAAHGPADPAAAGGSRAGAGGDRAARGRRVGAETAS